MKEFDPIKDKLIAVQTYKKGEGTGGWTNFNPNWPDQANSLNRVYDGRGYWINVLWDCVLNYGGYAYDLKAGWNLVGWRGIKQLEVDYLGLLDNEFRIRLINGEVERNWAVFSKAYRIELAKRILCIADVIPQSGYSRYPKLAYKVNGIIDESEANMKNMWCTSAAMINTARLSNGYPPGSSTSKWRDDMYYGAPGSWNSLIPDVYLHVGSVTCTAVYEFYPGHSGLAIQVGEDVTKFDSFHFFELSAETIGITVGRMGGASWTSYSSTPISKFKKENGTWVYKA